jgi:hypothetical protein
MKRAKRTELSGPYGSEICAEKRGQWVTLDYRENGKWGRSLRSPFRSVRLAKEQAEIIGARKIRILPNKTISVKDRKIKEAGE